MLLDANLPIYGVDPSAAHHAVARRWLEESMASDAPIAFPLISQLAFLRVTTNRKLASAPRPVVEVFMTLRLWLEQPNVWVPAPGAGHLAIFQALSERYALSGPDLMDGHLAALAIEHDLTIVSFDRGFGRFAEVRWLNPASP